MAELKGDFFNKEEIRSHDTRLSYINTFLPKLIETAKRKTLGFKENLEAINPKDIKTVEDLQRIPVLRKSELSNKQKLFPPFGGFERTEHQNKTHFFNHMDLSMSLVQEEVTGVVLLHFYMQQV